MRRWLVLAACAALLVVAGCDRTDDEDYDAHTERIEGELEPIVEDKYGGRVESIACPDDFDLSVGERYECEVTMADGRTFVALLESISKGVDDLVRVTRADE